MVRSLARDCRATYILLFYSIFLPKQTPLNYLAELGVMPTYEYECQKCGHQFEEFQSITAEPLKTCPQKGCRGKVKRLISAGGGLLFKGSGFYITDYRSEGYKKSAKAEADSKKSGTESTTSSNGKESGKSESKTATSPAAKD